MGKPTSALAAGGCPLPRTGDQPAFAELVDTSLVTVRCTYCHDGLGRDEAVFCASCLAPHHGDCHAEHGRCAGPGCQEPRTVRPARDPDAGGRRWTPALPADWQRHLALFVGAVLTLVGVGVGWRLNAEPTSAAIPTDAESDATNSNRDVEGGEPGSAQQLPPEDASRAVRPTHDPAPATLHFGAHDLALETRGFRYPIDLAAGERLVLRPEANGYRHVLLMPAAGAPSWRRPQTVMVVEPGDPITLVGPHGIEQPLVPSACEEVSLLPNPGGGLDVLTTLH